MGRPQDPFSHVLTVLRERLRSGALVRGERLMATVIARELGLSYTPVREALAWLAGEGLIEERRGLGYFAWRLDAVDLVELYDLQAGYLLSALDRDSGAAGELERPDDPLARTEALLLATVRRGRSHALERAHLRLGDQLAPARRVEPEAITDLDAEWAELAEALLEAEPPRLRTWTARYRARRAEAATALVSAMRSRAAETPSP